MDATWIFATLVPLDEANYEKDQDEESDGAHEADEPSLGGDVDLPAGHSCARTHRKEGNMINCEH